MNDEVATKAAPVRTGVAPLLSVRQGAGRDGDGQRLRVARGPRDRPVRPPLEIGRPLK